MHTAAPYHSSDNCLFQTEKITDRLTRIRMPGNVFTYYYRGEKSGLLIDTGLGYGSFRAFLEDPEHQLATEYPPEGGLTAQDNTARHLAAPQPYSVLLTHGHLDHAGGAGEFDQVYLHPSDLALAIKHADPALRARYLQENGVDHPLSDIEKRLAPPCREVSFLPACGEVSSQAPASSFTSCGDPSASLLWEEGLTENIRILPLPGHTRGSLVILFKKERILLAGDALNSWTLLFSAPDSPSMEEYHDALCRLSRDFCGQFDRILYSHPHNAGGPEILDQMIALTSDILSGKNSDSCAILRLGRPALLAKPVDPKTLLRKDGKWANLVYDADNLYTSMR